MNRNCATQSGPELPAGRRSIEKRSSHIRLPSRARNSSGGFALDFECNLVKADRPQDVEDADNVEMDSVSVTSNKHLRLGVLIMHFFQPRRQRVVIHLFLVEIRVAIGVNGDADVILFRLGFAALPGGQVHLDAFHVYWLKLTIMKLASRKNM